MIILGIDPGIARIGWGVISENSGKFQAIDYGCFETEAKLTQEVRLLQIHDFILETIEQFQPDTIAIEQLFFAANSKTALTVGQARGVIVLASTATGLPISHYTPLQVKLSITGYGHADKNQIQQMVKSILKLSKIPKPDDTADALAIALTHAFSHRLAKIR